jgi:hypothetical protein
MGSVTICTLSLTVEAVDSAVGLVGVAIVLAVVVKDADVNVDAPVPVNFGIDEVNGVKEAFLAMGSAKLLANPVLKTIRLVPTLPSVLLKDDDDELRIDRCERWSSSLDFLSSICIHIGANVICKSCPLMKQRSLE